MEQNIFLTQLAEILEIPAGALQASDELSSLENWDSLAVMNLIALVSDQYGTTLSPRQMAACNTVADLMTLVQSQSA